MSGWEEKAPKRGRGRPKRSHEPESSKSTATSPHNTSKPQGFAFPPINYTSSPFSSHATGSDPGQLGHVQQLPDSLELNAPPGKVAIPLLKQPQLAAESSSKVPRKGRISHACDLCRKAKAGCSGHLPCARCKSANMPCVYGDGKRAHDKKLLTKLDKKTSILAQHNSDVNDALRQIRLNSDLSLEEVRTALDGIIAMTPATTSSDEGLPSATQIRKLSSEVNGRDFIQDSDEDNAAEVGSTGSLDVVNVDTDREDVRATGHVGKSSAVAWAKRTAQEAKNGGEPVPPMLGKSNDGFSMESYHADDEDIEIIFTANANPYEWPNSKVADRLVQIYFEHCHGALPLLDKANFLVNYNNFTRGSSNLSESEHIWLGSLNAIFAISSVYSQFSKMEDSEHYFQHLWYFARAKKLLLDRGILYSDARVSSSRALGLIALYYLTTGRVNRSWTICGLAIRQALTLGLHVRSEALELSDVAKEHRVRLWWSLYTLECCLNELTGRPTCISDRDISTPWPINVNIDDLNPGQSLYKTDATAGIPGSSSSNPKEFGDVRLTATYQMPVGLQPSTHNFPAVKHPVTAASFFIYQTQLAIISHEIITELYCAATIKEKWYEVQATIERIDQRLTHWRDGLPKEFDIDIDPWTEPDWNNPFTLVRLSLSTHYYSSRMILFRPCLCRFDNLSDRGLGSTQSQDSRNFNQKAVESCIHSARQTISNIGRVSRENRHVYLLSPWWSGLHYICEALSVLLLEMACHSQHLPDEASYMLEDTKRGISWLSMMAECSVSARKAWDIFDILLRVVAPMIKWSVFDLPTQAPVPPGYDWQRYHSSQSSTNSAQQPLSEKNMTYAASTTPDMLASTNAWTSALPAQNFFTTAPFQSPPIAYAHNPLDHISAIRRFSNMGAIHGHYDDSWLQFFENNDPAMMASKAGSDAGDMGGLMGTGSQTFTPSGFGSGGYSPAHGSFLGGVQTNQEQGGSSEQDRRFQ